VFASTHPIACLLPSARTVVRRIGALTRGGREGKQAGPLVIHQLSHGASRERRAKGEGRGARGERADGDTVKKSTSRGLRGHTADSEWNEGKTVKVRGCPAARRKINDAQARKETKGAKENPLTNKAFSRSLLYSTCTSKRCCLLSYLWMDPYSRRRHLPSSARHSTRLETALTTRNVGATRVVTVVKLDEINPEAPGR
jgi:hypothetical protein